MTPEVPPKKESTLSKLEPVVALLFVGMIVFTGVLLACEKWFPNDGQIFQVIASLVSGFSGAFFMRVKPQGSGPDRGGFGSTAGSSPQVVVSQTNLDESGKS